MRFMCDVYILFLLLVANNINWIKIKQLYVFDIYNIKYTEN